MSYNSKIILAASICAFLVNWLILGVTESIFGAPEALPAFVISFFGSIVMGVVIRFIGLKRLVSLNQRRIFYLILWPIPLFFGATMGIYAGVLFFIETLILTIILYTRNVRVALEESKEENKKAPYFTARITMWFFGSFSIVFGLLIVSSLSSGCGSAPEFAGFGTFIFMLGAAVSFLIALPFMIFFGIKRTYIVDIGIFVLIAVVILLGSFVFLPGC